jgi:hypothetical protein
MTGLGNESLLGSYEYKKAQTVGTKGEEQKQLMPRGMG